MSNARQPRHGAGLAAVIGAALTLALVVLALSAWLPQQQPVATASAGPTEPPPPSITCTRDPSPLPSMLESDPCPAAVTAVELAVAPVRLPIRRIVIEPGPFYCDLIWPGGQSAAPCFGPIVRPGQYMHGWVWFHGSAEVAAVMLGLDLPEDLDQPGATRPPWHATLVTVEVPPAGWVMP